MPIFFDPCQGISVLFIHVPKCGGRSIIDFFLRNNFQIFYNQIDFPWHLQKCTLQHLPASELQLLLNLKEFSFIFSVSRHPYSRIASQYKYSILDPLNQGGIDDWYPKARYKYLRDPTIFDGHLRPISDYQLDNCLWFRFEDGFDYIIEQLGRKIGIRWTSPEIYNVAEYEHMHALRSSNNLARAMNLCIPSRATADRIFSDYKEDFSNFSYSDSYLEWLSSTATSKLSRLTRRSRYLSNA